MLYAVVHVCVMNNILMIIITLHSIKKSSNNIFPMYLNKSTDNSSPTTPDSASTLGLVIPIGYFILGYYNIGLYFNRVFVSFFARILRF